MEKSKRITIRLGEESYRSLLKKAESVGLRPSAFLRELLDNSTVIPCKNSAPPLPLLRELNAIGNNLNQIARHLNFGNRVDTAVLTTLSDIEERLEEVRSRYAR